MRVERVPQVELDAERLAAGDQAPAGEHRRAGEAEEDDRRDEHASARACRPCGSALSIASPMIHGQRERRGHRADREHDRDGERPAVRAQEAEQAHERVPELGRRGCGRAHHGQNVECSPGRSGPPAPRSGRKPHNAIRVQGQTDPSRAKRAAAGRAKGSGGGMPTWAWVAIALGIAAVLGGVLDRRVQVRRRATSRRPRRRRPASSRSRTRSRRCSTGIPQDGLSLGDPDAPVTLVEFADLQCPFCAEWAREALPVYVDDYVRTGQMRIEFRPLTFIGNESESAAEIAIAAGEQDKALERDRADLPQPGRGELRLVLRRIHRRARPLHPRARRRPDADRRRGRRPAAGDRGRRRRGGARTTSTRPRRSCSGRPAASSSACSPTRSTPTACASRSRRCSTRDRDAPARGRSRSSRSSVWASPAT